MSFKAKISYLTDHIVDQYDIQRFSSLKGLITDYLEKDLIKKAFKIANISLGSKVLDIPCGTGRLSIFLNRIGYHVEGGDISAVMVKKSQKKAALYGLNGIKFSVIDAEHINFPNEYFDAVVSLRLLGHTPPLERVKILRELNRVCKGPLILCYYEKSCIQEFLRRKTRQVNGNPWYPVIDTDIIEEFKQASLKEIKRLYLCRGISETVAIVARKLVNSGTDENIIGK
jgi:ubiquinone/menaquinone biosynthesis C-methylase UbiE